MTNAQRKRLVPVLNFEGLSASFKGRFVNSPVRSLLRPMFVLLIHCEDDDGVDPEERASAATNLINESDDEDVVYRYHNTTDWNE